jgi:hypothetical protein
MPLIFASDIWPTLANPSQGFIVLVLVVAFLLFVVVSMAGGYWFKLRKTEIEASLKREMIAQGMSAEEIERVLAARVGESPNTHS